jgi:threonine dehydrogenase-like Zn-dependent dehydrogenase
MGSESKAVWKASDFESWGRALQIIALGKLNLTEMISNKITLEQWHKTFCDLEAKKRLK